MYILKRKIMELGYFVILKLKNFIKYPTDYKIT